MPDKNGNPDLTFDFGDLRFVRDELKRSGSKEHLAIAKQLDDLLKTEERIVILFNKD